VTWTSDGGGTAFVTARPTDDQTLPLYFLFGGEGAATFPDLTALGVSLPHGASYSVYVSRVGGAATVDELAAHLGPFFGPSGLSAAHRVTTQ
jgi:hypothetical protein